MEEKRSLIHRSISVLLLLLILAFSASSIGNVTEYIHKWHVGGWGWVLGVGFGAVVFICAYLASISESRSNTWWIAIIVGSIFGITSASFQASIYIDGGAPWMTAGALSFIPIIVGEVGLALLESSFSKDHLAQVESGLVEQLRVTVEQLKNTINDLNVQLRNALSHGEQLNIENAVAIEQLNTEHTERIKRLHTEHQEVIDKLNADHAGAVQNMTQELNTLDGKITAITRENERLNAQLNTRLVVQPVQQERSKSAPVRAERSDDDKLERTLQFFTEHPGGSLREAAEHVGCSVGSVSSYASKLVEFDKLNKVDGKYYPAIATIPTVATVHTNGYHKQEG